MTELTNIYLIFLCLFRAIVTILLIGVLSVFMYFFIGVVSVTITDLFPDKWRKNDRT